MPEYPVMQIPEKFHFMTLSFINNFKTGLHKLCVFSLLFLFLPAGLAASTGDTLPPPSFSQTSGFYPFSVGLVLATRIPGANIYYTLDGSEPDPANLNGSTFRYKNTWPQRPGQPKGGFLYDSYKSEVYTSFITISERQNTPDRLARKATSYHNPPFYFPDSPIMKGTVVRAMTVRAGFVSSPVVTHTYFIFDRSRYRLPVISITTGEKNLFDYDSGIYTPGAAFDLWRDYNPGSDAGGGSGANYRRRGADWEIPANFTFWDVGSKVPDLNQNVGIRIHGGYSRAHPMKSLRIYARSDYGKSTLEFPFFPDQPYGEYKRLMLRNSGNDFGNSFFRDALIHEVCRELNFDTQAYRPVIVFLNGEYWGIHNIRERYDRHYIERVYGVKQQDLDLLSWRNSAKEGDNRHYNETIGYIEANGLHLSEHYNHIKTRIDTENFIDYQIANIYSANTDWPANNIDFWRKRTGYQPFAPHGHDGRWRWMAFDMDFGFGIWGKSPAENVMRFATEANGPGWPNPPWSTFLLRSFLENESFRADFVNRFAGLLNTHFRPERVVYLIDKFYNVLKPEFPEHIARWKHPSTMTRWDSEVNAMRNYVIQRPAHQWGHLMDYFNLDTVSVTLEVSSPSHGYIRLNDIDITPSTPGVYEDPYPWKGIYFSGIPVTFEAVPLEGYRFSHWEGTSSGMPVFTADPSGSAMIKAHFVPAPEMDIVHLWHFNDLPGDDMIQAVAADYSAGEPGELSYPGEGEGFMDRVDDGAMVNLQENLEPGGGLRVRNPSHTRQLVLSVPSTGFDSLEFSYATRRTPNGAWNQAIWVSADNGGSWSQVGETFVVSEDWQRVILDLSDLPQLGDNADMQIKILFGGETAPGGSGNNRFDNITLRGRFLYEHASYYNKPDGRLNETSSWGRETDGSGQEPVSFDTPGAVYHIQNGDEATLSGNWTVSGLLSRVVLGGPETVTFTIPPGYSCTGPIGIKDSATLVLQNVLLPELKKVSPASTVVFQQEEAVVPARSWGNLHMKGGVKVFSGDYLVQGNLTAEDAGLSFTGPTSLTLEGDLAYTGNVTTHDPENLNVLVTGAAHQLFRAEGGNLIEAYNFYAEKTEGTLSLASDIIARNNLRLDFSGNSIFTDNGHTLQLGDDLRIRGDEKNFDLSGTLLLKASSGTNDMEITGVQLHNLVIDTEGDARVDFNDASPAIRVNNNMTIRSRSSRPVRLRDKRYNIMGSLLIDVERAGQIGKGESMIHFMGENLQVLENMGYGGPGLLHGLVVSGAGIEVKGNVTVDSLIRFENGMVQTGPGNLLKLGPNGTIVQSSPHSYVNGPMGIYNSKRETATMEFPVGKQNGLRKVVLKAGHENENLRLYTTEFLDQPPPQLALGGGISRILENHGYYYIATDRQEEISNLSVGISYDGEPYPADSIIIVTERGGEWVSIGSEAVPGMQKMLRSTSNLQQTGQFVLAVKKASPLSSPFPVKNFNVYPNPVSLNGTIYLPEIMDVTMVSSSGITVLSADNVISLSLEGIPPGIYILKNRLGWHSRIIITGRP
jgi:hypothetical protein